MKSSYISYSDSDDLVFRLASPVISASFQCDTCTTSNLFTPVQVTFRHTEYDQVPYHHDKSSCMNAECMYMGCLNISSYLPPSIPIY